jgi:hypothetical protein
MHFYHVVQIAYFSYFLLFIHFLLIISPHWSYIFADYLPLLIIHFCWLSPLIDHIFLLIISLIDHTFLLIISPYWSYIFATYFHSLFLQRLSVHLKYNSVYYRIQINGVNRLTWQVPLVELELLTNPEHLSLPPGF